MAQTTALMPKGTSAYCSYRPYNQPPLWLPHSLHDNTKLILNARLSYKTLTYLFNYDFHIFIVSNSKTLY